MVQLLKLILLLLLLTFSLELSAQKWEKVFSDTTVLFFDSVTIGGKKYIACLKEDLFFLLNGRNDTIIKRVDYYFNMSFSDFNKDGHKDIMLHYSSNTPLIFYLFLYVPSVGKFREVIDFHNFPAPEPIKGTKYYYSYHKSGCADLNWDSDLFYIQNFKAIRIGNIAGRECNNRNGVKDAIYIYKIINKKKALFKTLPIGTIRKYEEHKWGFIKEYWNSNYKQFFHK